MHSLSAVFLQKEPKAILHQIIASLTFDLEQYQSNDPGPSDEAIADGVKVALRLLKQGELQKDLSILTSYTHEANQYLLFVRNKGLNFLLQNQHSSQEIEMTEKEASNINLLTIVAEAYLAATSFLTQDKDVVEKYINSANNKIRLIARHRSSGFKEVHESETIHINLPRSRVQKEKSWEYHGQRPEQGSSARLAQDIDFGYRTLTSGDLPNPYDVFKSWIKVI